MKMSGNSSARGASDEELLGLFETLALAAGSAALRHFRTGARVETKADASPVTVADREAEAIVLKGLVEAGVGLPCVSEEEACAGAIPLCDDGTLLLVDPLDGTREFIAGRPDFTVNIALVRRGMPEIGVVYAPARDLLFSAIPGTAFEVTLAEGRETARKTITARKAPEKPVLLASCSHRTAETDAFLGQYADAEIVSIGSSLKFGLLARGEADIYPRFGRTMQWDTAAGDAVLRAAGGAVAQLDGAPLAYGPGPGEGLEAFVNPSFIATGKS